jgi:predicted membrane protein
LDNNRVLFIWIIVESCLFGQTIKLGFIFVGLYLSMPTRKTWSHKAPQWTRENYNGGEGFGQTRLKETKRRWIQDVKDMVNMSVDEVGDLARYRVNFRQDG